MNAFARKLAFVLVLAIGIGILPIPWNILSFEGPRYQVNPTRTVYTGDEAKQFFASRRARASGQSKSSFEASGTSRRLDSPLTHVRVVSIKRERRPLHRPSLIMTLLERTFGATTVQARTDCEEYYPTSLTSSGVGALLQRMSLRDDCEDVDELLRLLFDR